MNKLAALILTASAVLLSSAPVFANTEKAIETKALSQCDSDDTKVEKKEVHRATKASAKEEAPINVFLHENFRI